MEAENVGVATLGKLQAFGVVETRRMCECSVGREKEKQIFQLQVEKEKAGGPGEVPCNL